MAKKPQHGVMLSCNDPLRLLWHVDEKRLGAPRLHACRTVGESALSAGKNCNRRNFLHDCFPAIALQRFDEMVPGVRRRSPEAGEQLVKTTSKRFTDGGGIDLIRDAVSVKLQLAARRTGLSRQTRSV